jgi:hypothetical protein
MLNDCVSEHTEAALPYPLEEYLLKIQTVLGLNDACEKFQNTLASILRQELFPESRANAS